MSPVTLLVYTCELCICTQGYFYANILCWQMYLTIGYCHHEEDYNKHHMTNMSCVLLVYYIFETSRSLYCINSL